LTSANGGNVCSNKEGEGVGGEEGEGIVAGLCRKLSQLPSNHYQLNKRQRQVKKITKSLLVSPHGSNSSNNSNKEQQQHKQQQMISGQQCGS